MGNLKTHIVIICISLFTLIFFACNNSNQETSSDDNTMELAENMTDTEQRNLFIIESDSLNRSWITNDENNSRQRMADINPSFISVDSSGVGQNYIFNVYEDEILMGKIRNVSTDINGLKSISGLLDEERGSFVFTVSEGQLLGQLRLTDRDKLIQINFIDEQNEYVFTEINRNDLDVLPGSAPLRRGNK